MLRAAVDSTSNISSEQDTTSHGLELSQGDRSIHSQPLRRSRFATQAGGGRNSFLVVLHLLLV